MSTYSKKQNKKSLGIDNLRGVTVLNIANGKKFNVRFRAEVNINGTRYQRGNFDTASEAASVANTFFKEAFGSTKDAKKAGYWNSTN